LRRVLLRSELLKKGQLFQDFAYATEGRNRVIGSPGHNATVNYLINTISALNYYDIEVQPFTVPSASADLSVNSVVYEVAPMTFTAEGTPQGPVVVVSNLGCDAVNIHIAPAGGVH
jgi:carboxypeptidase Q